MVKYLPPNQTNHISAESEKTLGDLAKKKKKMRVTRIRGRRVNRIGQAKSNKVRHEIETFFNTIEITSKNKALAAQKSMELRMDLSGQ